METSRVPEGAFINYKLISIIKDTTYPNFQTILTATSVEGIQLKGGTVLGTCKEAADLTACVARMKLWGINQLYVIGGDGSKCGESTSCIMSLEGMAVSALLEV